MANKIIPFFLLCETPLHVGVGQDVGIIDMPIQRERHTGWPKIEASGLKGSIRNSFEVKFRNEIEKLVKTNIIFGYDESYGGLKKELRDRFKDKKDFAGALGITDARILLFPVKSMKGVFAWVTCPAVLTRFIEDLRISETKVPMFNIVENTINKDSNCKIEKSGTIAKAILEEYTVNVVERKNGDRLGEWIANSILPKSEIYNNLKEKLKKDIIVLTDDLFTDFTKLATEVTTRTKINNETGTVSGQALFTEEYLPTETIMYSMAIASPAFAKPKGSFEKGNEKEVLEFFKSNIDEVIQIGGNAGLGKGLVSIRIFNPEEV